MTKLTFEMKEIDRKKKSSPAVSLHRLCSLTWVDTFRKLMGKYITFLCVYTIGA